MLGSTGIGRKLNLDLFILVLTISGDVVMK